ncbi:hypothetical protein [Rhizorhabdus wittichii]|uniref:hypothetical protein n=1 Tax=Rhizorhabdus wittichii TaxID=160791 RepID=UPI0003618792|nr:hypothetical protein [Rhizorhabdus wittichii]
MYKLEYQPALNLLDVIWAGLLTSSDMADYASDCRMIRDREGLTPGFRLRIMVSDGTPLPQASLAALSGAFADFPKPSRQAWVTSSAIVTLQIKRTMLWPYARIFVSADEALAWLTASDGDACMAAIADI